MKSQSGRLSPHVRRAITTIFDRLDYGKLGSIYCDYGGDSFWKEHQAPCQTLGIKIAEALMPRLSPGGRSLYVGAGVAEIPVLVMEALACNRDVAAYNLRADEVALLNEACKGQAFCFECREPSSASGGFDHLWIVSVLNDPEQFPELSSLSYGTASPLTFDPTEFARERERVRVLVEACLGQIARPALVTTSVEETGWIVEWCKTQKLTCVVGEERYPTALVGDPICFIQID